MIGYKEGEEHRLITADGTFECKTASNTHDIKIQEGKRIKE